MNRLRYLRGLSVAVLFTAPVAVCTAQPANSEPGVWQSHQIRFTFLASSPKYSCEGLRRSLTELLTLSGARADAQVDPGPCSNGYGTPETLLYATLKFSTLMPAGNGTAGSAGTGAPGAWQSVSIAPNHPTDLRGADCELVDEFRAQVLITSFATRDLKATLHCADFQTTGYMFRLRFEVFAPAGMSQH